MVADWHTAYLLVYASKVIPRVPASAAVPADGAAMDTSS